MLHMGDLSGQEIVDNSEKEYPGRGDLIVVRKEKNFPVFRDDQPEEDNINPEWEGRDRKIVHITWS